MTWSIPKTWASEPLTSLDLNRYVRDNQLDIDLRLRSISILRDEKPQSTHGGTFVAGAWQQRDLNIKYGDPGGYVTLASNQFTLASGSYLLRATVPGASGINVHQARLYNVTTGTTAMYGTVVYSGTGTAMLDYSFITALVAHSGPATFEIQHRCAATINNTGFGFAANFGTEVYTTVEIWRFGPEP